MVIITPKNKSVEAYEGLHLFHGNISNCSMRVRMTLIEKGLSWTSHHIDLKKKENRISFVSSLSKCRAVLDGKIVMFNVKNALQEEQLNSERAGILFHLRQRVKCADLELSICLEKDDNEPKIFLTDKEKYLQMAEKNPALEDLRKRLDLDIA